MGLRDQFELRIGRTAYDTFTAVLRRRARLIEGVAEFDGVRVPYLYREGRGTPLVLVHGFGGDKESWLLMAAWLPRARPLLVLDLPGFGRADAIEPAHASARAQARAVGRLLAARQIARAHVVGNSMGGGIALRLAADDPARVASLSLLGSTGPEVEQSEVARALARGENPLLLDGPEDLGRLLRLVAQRPPIQPRPVVRYLGAALAARRERYHRLFKGWREPASGDGVPEDLTVIMAPALVVHGAHDRVIHPATAHALAARLPRAELELYADLGHAPQLEAPRRVAERITAFVDPLG